MRAGVNKKPPPSVAGDMFAEMAWKKKQKEAKKAWEDAKGQVKSLATVLKQEIEGFNKLLLVLWDTLENLQRAIKGLVVMNLVLQEVYDAFLNNQVPNVWSNASCPSLAPLGEWANDLVLRLAFIQDWLVHGPPRSF